VRSHSSPSPVLISGSSPPTSPPSSSSDPITSASQPPIVSPVASVASTDPPPSGRISPQFSNALSKLEAGFELELRVCFYFTTFLLISFDPYNFKYWLNLPFGRLSVSNPSFLIIPTQTHKLIASYLHGSSQARPLRHPLLLRQS
jgi:hypothetical protein